jgi:hypothetical protein
LHAAIKVMERNSFIFFLSKHYHYVKAPLALKVASYWAPVRHGRINDYGGYGLLALIIALALAPTLSGSTTYTATGFSIQNVRFLKRPNARRCALRCAAAESA